MPYVPYVKEKKRKNHIIGHELWEKCQVDLVKPPFSGIPSFIVSALILSFGVSRKNVKSLLFRLSKNSIGYYYKHKAILEEFLFDNPCISTVLKFGVQGRKWNCEYPFAS